MKIDNLNSSNDIIKIKSDKTIDLTSLKDIKILKVEL